MDAELIVLNEGINATSDEVQPLVVANGLQKLILKLKGLSLLDEKTVDYVALYNNELFQEYLQLAGQLKSINLNKLIESEEQTRLNTLAFFINVYNSLTIHALAHLHQNDKPSNDSTMLNQAGGKFWSRMAYRIGQFDFSLDDIEHGILRANRVHPSSNKRFFSEQDPRLAFALKKLDPRIHFALNCGAKGCPPIAFYTPQNVERGLELATIGYCISQVEVDTEKRVVKVPRLFLWYKLDFIYQSEDEIDPKADHDQLIIKFLEKHLGLNNEIGQQLEKLKSSEVAVGVEFLPYDWTINSKI